MSRSSSSVKGAQERAFTLSRICWGLEAPIRTLVTSSCRSSQPSADAAFQKLIPRIHPGAVVLLHSTSQTNAQILDELLTRWEKLGYRFAPIEELFQETNSAAE